MSRSKYKYQDDEEEDIGQYERFKNKTSYVSSIKPEISKEMSRSKYKYQDDEEEDIGQYERFKNKTSYVSSIKPEISKEMSRSKYKYQDDEEEDIGQYERFKNKTSYVSSIKPEISKEMLRSKYKYQDDEEEYIGQYERFKNKTSYVSSIKPEISKETSRSKYMPQNVNDASFSELCERAKSRAQAASESYEDDDSQTRQKGKAGSGIEDVSSSSLEKSKENSTETCMNCGKKVPVHELSTHKEVCSKILKKQCEYCDKELHCDDSEENHLKNCAVFNHSISETQLLSKHFKDLFTNESCWDTVLQIGSKEFKVHRAILIARSSVFFAMFQHDSSEKQSGIVKIPDCDPDSFQQFLEYLYCGKLKHFSSDIALPLYTISDKYNVLELKTLCTKYLMKNITAQNMCEVAILADKFDETELFSATEKFFSKNFKEIVMTSEWESLMKRDFRLANKLLIGKAKAE